jgi:hypothetical protein
MKNCLCSAAPKDDELLRYVLDGEALSTQATEHMKVCHICQQRLEHYCYAQRFLQAQLYRSQCPGMTTLGSYCLRLLPADEMYNLEQHIARCPLCQSEVADTYQALALTENDEAVVHTAPLNNFDRIPVTEPLDKDTAAVSARIDRNPQTDALPLFCPLIVQPYSCQMGTTLISFSISYDETQQQTVLYALLEDIAEARQPRIFTDTHVELYQLQQFSYTHDTSSLHDEIARNTTPPYRIAQVDPYNILKFQAVQAGTYFIIIYLPETALVIENIRIQ